MNGHEAATKQDLQAVRQDLQAVKQDLHQDLQTVKQDLEGKIDQLRSEMNHQYNDVLERISDSETKLLKAFYSYAESNDKRMTQQDANMAVFLSRMSSFETACSRSRSD